MTEILPCRLCGTKAPNHEMDFWYCSNQECAACGPSDDHDGTKWNALMAGAHRAVTDPPAGTVRVRSHPMPDIITGPGIYQMRNGDFVAIMWTEHACAYPWRDAFREGWTASGRYCIGHITPFDIVRRSADLPEVGDG